MSGRRAVQAVDPEVVHQHLAGDEVNAQRPDVQRPFDVLRPVLLGGADRRRSEIDGDRHHDRGCEQRGEQRHAEAGVSEDSIAAEPLEEGLH
jgi:hypothetical protein